MNRTALCAVAAAILLAAPGGFAQQKLAPWKKEPATIFGLTLGEKLSPEDIRDCTKTTDPNDPPPRIAFCKLSSFNPSRLQVAVFGIDVFRDGTLVLEDGIAAELIVRGRHADYDEIRDVLTERYGPPAVRVLNEVKTRAGATFKSETLRWSGRQVSIQLMERVGDLDTTVISFARADAAARDLEERRTRAKRDAAKM